MKTTIKFTLICASLLIFIGANWSFGHTQSVGTRYFPETGHNVEGEFLEFYRRVANPEFVYGYPITEAFTSRDGMYVQYFQRARFELGSRLGSDQRVELTLLGEVLYEPIQPFPLVTNPGVCRDFPETKQQVCYSFLRFFDAYGGIDQFGYPISGVELRDNRLVQYFQKARFEWHPENASVGQEVQLTHLGRFFFDITLEDPIHLRPTVPPDGIPEIIRLHVFAFPVQAVIPQGEMQSVFVIVQNQNFNPVPGVEISVSLRTPSGKSSSFSLGVTNEFGFVNGPIGLEMDASDIGIVEVDVIARYKETFLQAARTSFRVSP